MNKKFIFLLFPLFITPVFGQVDLGLNAGVGLGSIKKHTKATNIDFAPQLSPSMQLGVFANYQVYCAFNIGAELNYTHYTDIEYIYYQSAFSPDPKERKVSTNMRQNLSTISIPFYLKFSHHKMDFIVGPQFSFINYYTIKEKTEYLDSTGATLITETKTKENHHQMDYGFVCGMHFNFTTDWAGSIRFYQSLRSSFESGDPFIPTITPTSFMLGVRYKLN